MKNSRVTTKANGLELIELGSETRLFEDIPINGLNGIVSENMSGKAYVAAWLDYKVLIGTLVDGRFSFYKNETFDPKYIRQMRIFDSENELHILRTRNGFKARLRKDDLNGNGTLAVLAEQVLFGTRKKESDDEKFTIITEDRGTTIILPFPNIAVDEGLQRIALKTYNYLEYNGVHQAAYVDCRFAGFTNGGAPLT